VTYTVLDLATLRSLRDADAAAELISLARADLALICQHLKLKTPRSASVRDLTVLILAHTHPRQAMAAPAGEASVQTGMF